MLADPNGQHACNTLVDTLRTIEADPRTASEKMDTAIAAATQIAASGHINGRTILISTLSLAAWEASEMRGDKELAACYRVRIDTENAAALASG
jgi:hypothetical protein